MGGSHFVAVRVWSSSSSGEGDWVKLKVEMGKVEMGDWRLEIGDWRWKMEDGRWKMGGRNGR